MLVQIAVCKYHPKLTTGRPEMGTSAGGEGQDGDRGGVAVSDSTYTERGRGDTFQLKENEAYATHLQMSNQ